MTNFEKLKEEIAKMTVEDMLNDDSFYNVLCSRISSAYCRRFDASCEACQNAWLKDGVKALIDRQPTADVVPRSESEWDYDEENECFICSNCKSSALNNYRGLSVDSNYCPNCGAKMKEDSNG